MNRSRREIKTPKRFDEEPFEAPRKSIGKQQTTPVAADPKPQTPVLVAPPVVAPQKTVKQPEPSFTPKIKLPKLGQKSPQKILPKNNNFKPAEPSPKTPKAKPVSPPPNLDAVPVLPKIALPKRQSQIQAQPQVPPPPPPALDSQEDSSEPPTPTPTPKKTITKQQTKPPTTDSNNSVTKTPQPPKPKPPKLEIVKTPTLDTNIKSHNYKCSRRKGPASPPAYDTVIPNKVLPFWDARTAAEEHEDDNVKELVHCHCGIPEELGLMVQCETCLTWQHAHCLGFEKPEDAPDGYTCQACSDPKFARDSMRWAYDQDWLLKGKMKQFTCDKGTHEKERQFLQKVNKLIEDSLKVHQLIHSLRVKSKILNNAVDDEDPELKLFRNQWPCNYIHLDGSPFVPTLIQLPNSPASTMSAMAGTPDPGDLPVEAVADLRGALPDIGQLDVSAILGNTDIPLVSANPEPAPTDCRSNLKLHIKQTEEFITIELGHIAEQMAALEKESMDANSEISRKINFGLLKNDLVSIRRYLDQRTASS